MTTQDSTLIKSQMEIKNPIKIFCQLSQNNKNMEQQRNLGFNVL